MHQTTSYLLLSCIFVLFTGCDNKTESEELETSQLRAIYDVRSNGNNQAEITAEFTYLSDVIDGILPVTESIELSGGDQLTVETAEEVSGFSVERVYGDYIYTANTGVGDEETEFRVILNRPSRSESIVSTVMLAPVFEITEPIEGQASSLHETHILRWAPVIYDRRSSFCIRTSCYQRILPDSDHCTTLPETGAHVFSVSDYFVNFYNYRTITPVNSNSCSATISLSRHESGQTLYNYAFTSRIGSRQKRSKTININLN